MTAQQATSMSVLGGCVRVAIPPSTLTRERPFGEPTTHFRFEENLRVDLPATVVAELPRGRVVCGRNVSVVTGDGILVHEMSPYHGSVRVTENPLFLHPFIGLPTLFDGRIGVIAGSSDYNYCHFLMDIFHRPSLLDRCGEIEPPDRWYAPLDQPFQRELLQMMGINLESVIDSTKYPHIQAEVLVVPGYVDMFLQGPQWTISHLRSRLRPVGARTVPGRRLFVPRLNVRANNRIILNHEAVQRGLEERGFVTIDPGQLSVAEQVRQFSEAEWIVGTHGAAMVNLAFASPGARAVELFAPDLVAPCFWSLSQRVPELDYRYVVGAGTRSRFQQKSQLGVTSDMTIDVPTLLRVLDADPQR